MKISRKHFLLGSLGILAHNVLHSQTIKKKQEENIGIIGAGFAGLFSGYLLSQRGIPFQIFEASSRIGGRVRPLHDFADFPVELGAETVLGENSIYFKILQNLKVPLIKKEFENYYVLKEKLVEESEADLDKNFSKTISLIHELKSYNQNEDISLLDYIKSHKIPSSYFHILEVLVGNEYSANIQDLNLKEISENLRNWKSGEEKFWIRNRSHLSVMEEMVGGVVNQVLLNTPIVQIDYSGKNVILKDENGKEYEFTRVIITVPLSILKNGKIKFNPNLPSSHKNAISELQVGSAIKIVLQFQKRFWEKNTGSIVNDGWISEFYPSGYLKGNANNVLVGYVVGENAKKLSKYENELHKQALKELNSIFGKNVASRLFVDKFIQNWGKEPFIQGATSYPSKGSRELREKLSEPIDERLFFAGEALSVNHYATMQGALESAQKVVNSIPLS